MQTARLVSERSFRQLLCCAVEARASGLVVLRCREGLRHGVWVEAGYVVGVHVAGRFDPLLALLRHAGALSAHAHRTCLEALQSGRDRSGELATNLAAVPSSAVREALRRQVVERFAALLELAEQHGHDAQLEPGRPPPGECSVRMPIGSLLRHAERATGVGRPDGGPGAPLTGASDDARRALRSLAKALHPDRHAHLDAEARARMEHELACATAAYHGFVSSVGPAPAR